jgi:hypothetical protein
VTWDYKTATLKIKYYGLKKISFAPKAKTIECKLIAAEQMDKDLLQGILGAVIYTYIEAPADPIPVTAVEAVLTEFADVFAPLLSFHLKETVITK